MAEFWLLFSFRQSLSLSFYLVIFLAKHHRRDFSVVAVDHVDVALVIAVLSANLETYNCSNLTKSANEMKWNHTYETSAYQPNCVLLRMHRYNDNDEIHTYNCFHYTHCGFLKLIVSSPFAWLVQKYYLLFPIFTDKTTWKVENHYLSFENYVKREESLLRFYFYFFLFRIP